MLHPKQQLIKNTFGKEPETLDEIAQACVALITRKYDLLGFAWDISYTPKTSNSHSAPLSGYRNWGGSKGPIRGYEGFTGRVFTRFGKSPNSFSSSVFEPTLTYTGSGGAGAHSGIWADIEHAIYRGAGLRGIEHVQRERVNCLSYEYRIYLTDFPAFHEYFKTIQVKFEKEQIFNKLSDRFVHDQLRFNHHFEWEDAETHKQDEKYLAAYREANGATLGI